MAAAGAPPPTPLEPPATRQPGPTTPGGRLRPTVYLATATAAFLLAWAVSQWWTAGDMAVAHWVDGHLDASAKAAWRAGSWPGATLTLVALAAGGMAACLALREWRAAAATAAAGFLTGFAVSGLKALVGRDRPDGAVLDTYAFPSGHSASSMLGWGLLALVVLPAVARHVRVPALARRFAVGIWIGVAAATGATRVLGGVHWASDVVGGWAFGGVVLAVAVRAARTDRPPPRMPKDGASAPPG